MLIVGLTGGLGTGKTTVAAMFQELGARVIDADALAHKAIEPGGVCYRRVVGHFGPGILRGQRGPRPAIDRRKLAQIVFNDRRALKCLEQIIHPHVHRQIDKEIAVLRKRTKNSIVVVDVPLLFESGLDRDMDVTIAVRAKRAQQIRRSRKRALTQKAARRRIAAQMPLGQKIRRADMVVDNRGSLPETRRQVRRMWMRLSRMKSHRKF